MTSEPALSLTFLGIIFATFQGELRMETQQVLLREEEDKSHKPQFDIDRGMSTVYSTFVS